MSESTDRDAKRPGQSKVSELDDVVAAIDEQVLRLEVAVEHAVGVAVGDATQNLVEEALHGTAQDREHSPALQFAFHCRLGVVAVVGGGTVTGATVRRLDFSKQMERKERKRSG